VDRTLSLPPLGAPVRALLLGFVAGLRSQVPVAVLAVQTERGAFDPGPLGRRFIASSPAVAGTVSAAAGELAVDKLPVAPSRLSLFPFAQRLATGAMVGAAVHYDAGRPRALGALLGAAGGGAGAFAGTRARTLLAERTRLPGPLLGAAEDLLAVGLALAVVAAAHDEG
jgi:uncharacterized membrane protein